jgi:hypothetical protein
MPVPVVVNAAHSIAALELPPLAVLFVTYLVPNFQISQKVSADARPVPEATSKLCVDADPGPTSIRSAIPGRQAPDNNTAHQVMALCLRRKMKTGTAKTTVIINSIG